MDLSKQSSHQESMGSGACMQLGQIFLPILTMLGFMSLERFLNHWSSIWFFHGFPKNEIVMAYLVGIRFDSMILGFAFLPLSLLFVISTLFLSDFKKFFVLLRVWMMVVWFVVLAVMIWDFLFFTQEGARLTWMEWSKSNGLDYLIFSVKQTKPVILFLNFLIWICMFYVVFRQIRFYVVLPPIALRSSKAKRILFSVFVLIVFALMARGTVTAHHLGWGHTKFTKHRILQELSVNGIWTFDKNSQRY